jgi:hypothetical protein
MPELELIASLLYITRLGKGVSPYRDAAGTLMEKIEEYVGDDDFTEDSNATVMPMFAQLDNNGIEIDAFTSDFIEIIV